jgi:O-methyltransferase
MAGSLGKKIRNQWRRGKMKRFMRRSQRMNDKPYFLQGRMDIDDRSFWFEPDFNRATGGYFIKNDPIERARAPLPNCDHTRSDMLTLLCRSIAERKVRGAVAELGVYKGETAKLLHHYLPDRELHLFDTFTGFSDSDLKKERAVMGMAVGNQHLRDTNREQVLRYIQPINQQLKIFVGEFPESVSEELAHVRYALVHLDADLHAPTKAGLEHFYPLMSSGGFIVVHDYNAWPGARRAVDEFAASEDVIPIPMPDKSGSCVIVK